MASSQNNPKKSERKLTDDEVHLWTRVTDTVDVVTGTIQQRPTRTLKQQDQGRPADGESNKPASVTQAPNKKISPYIDRRTRAKVARGRRTIGGTLDLHGMRQAEAHLALRRFLAKAQQQGSQFVVVITGKGNRNYERSISDPSEPRTHGILRLAVPQWMATEEFRRFIVGYSEAAPTHGGSGALYVQIRRMKGGG